MRKMSVMPQNVGFFALFQWEWDFEGFFYGDMPVGIISCYADQDKDGDLLQTDATLGADARGCSGVFIEIADKDGRTMAGKVLEDDITQNWTD